MRRQATRGSNRPSGSSGGCDLTPDVQSRIQANREAAKRRRFSQLVRPLTPVGWVNPAMASKPSDFQTDHLDLPKVTFLSKLNAHPRDRRIEFYEADHVYLINDRPTVGSVTGLVHAFSEPFDEHATIARMAAGRNWPRAGYLRPSVPARVWEGLSQLQDASRLLELMSSDPLDEHAVCVEARSLQSRCPQASAFVKDICMSPEEIRAKWEANRNDAANRGTWMHHQFECWLNRCPVDDETVEFALFHKFTQTLAGLTAFRTEWVIYAEAENLAGSIDFVAQDPHGHLVLFDWKRSKACRESSWETDARIPIGSWPHRSPFGR